MTKKGHQKFWREIFSGKGKIGKIFHGIQKFSGSKMSAPGPASALNAHGSLGLKNSTQN